EDGVRAESDDEDRREDPQVDAIDAEPGEEPGEDEDRRDDPAAPAEGALEMLADVGPDVVPGVAARGRHVSAHTMGGGRFGTPGGDLAPHTASAGLRRRGREAGSGRAAPSCPRGSCAGSARPAGAGGTPPPRAGTSSRRGDSPSRRRGCRRRTTRRTAGRAPRRPRPRGSSSRGSTPTASACSRAPRTGRPIPSARRGGGRARAEERLAAAVERYRHAETLALGPERIVVRVVPRAAIHAAGSQEDGLHAE